MKVNRTPFLLRTGPEPSSVARDDFTPQIFIAPELRGHELEHAVVRHDDDSDDDYASRCELVALVLDAAKKS
jgi:hypothetical protein